MATKKRATKHSSKSSPKPVPSTAHEVWLAGLGALVIAQRQGRKRYEALVKQGQTLEKRIRELATTSLTETRRSVMGAANEMTRRGEATLRGMQRAMTDQVGRAVSGLGVAKAVDLRQVQERFEELVASARSLAKLPGQWASTTPLTMKPKQVTRRRAAGKKAVRRKAGSS
jgi:poly(hydroxyalkanoate) granule-associated protein